jgi:tripartite-type tricarboxylate transporter receptor subunit TctC
MSANRPFPFDPSGCSRRDVLGGAGALLLLGATGTNTAMTQTAYPNRPIRMMVGFAAGGPTDIVARTVAQKLSELLGQQVVVENRPGASSNIATQAVIRSESDGYTILMGSLSNAVNHSLFKDLTYDFMKELAPISPLAETAVVLVVHPSLDVKSVKDMIALAKSANPAILYASAGRGTATHLAAEMFNVMAGTKMDAVHYKGGGDTLKDLLSGQIKVMFSTIPPVVGFINDGRLRGIATTGPTRDQSLPSLPTIAESGLPGFDMRLWFGLMAPAGTSPEIIKRLSDATRQALGAPDVKAAFSRSGFTALAGTSEEFRSFIRQEVDKWAKVVQAVPSLSN